MTGSISLAAGAIEPRGERIAVRVGSPTGQPTIKLIDRRTGSVTDELGPGAMAAWLSSAKAPSSTADLVMTARDVKGEYQLWRLAAQRPHDREQLTFLDGGTTPTFSLSSDGRFVVAGGREGNLPWAVIVELNENPVSDSLTPQR